LQRLHLRPIDVSSRRLSGGFPGRPSLRSAPAKLSAVIRSDTATQRCHWRDKCTQAVRSNPVLSYKSGPSSLLRPQIGPNCLTTF